MPKATSDLILIVALAETLVEALEGLDDPIAADAPLDGLRAFSEKAKTELDIRAQRAVG